MSREVSVDLDACGIEPPEPGRLLAVVWTRHDCSSCPRLATRMQRLVDSVAVDVVEIDTAEMPAAASANGIDRVPSLALVDSERAVVRRWLGEPLAGTLERSVVEYFSTTPRSGGAGST